MICLTAFFLDIRDHGWNCPSRTQLAFELPCWVKVDALNLVVAPPSIDGGAETPVLGLLQRCEAVTEKTLKTRLSGFQHLHVLQTAVEHRDTCAGGGGGYRQLFGQLTEAAIMCKDMCVHHSNLAQCHKSAKPLGYRWRHGHAAPHSVRDKKNMFHNTLSTHID